MPTDDCVEIEADQQRAMARILALVQALAPLDRQVILLYLEGIDATAIGDVTGLSAGNVATKIHRIKRFSGSAFTKEDTVHNEPPVPGLHALWQNQRAEGDRVSAEDTRRKSERLQQIARRRITAFYLMGAGNAGIPLALMWFLPELRLALGYLVATAVVLVSYVRRRGALLTLPPPRRRRRGWRSSASSSGANGISDETARAGLPSGRR